MNHAPWSEAATIYEVNLRQFTAEGTLTAFGEHLPRLAALGVGILWLMPIHPVGLKNRKGPLGSPYSVKDHRAVDPHLGTLDDLKAVVDRAHALGMRVILDWVANHTAWDHVWVGQHPDWYLKDTQGMLHSYTYDNGKELEYWTDVVGLDYRQPAVWEAMADALLYWVDAAGIDGYRCDVAGLVPTAFWEQVRTRLEAQKPVFLLAEWWSTDLHARAFDMTYDWGTYDLQREIVQGTKTAIDLRDHLVADRAHYPADAYRMVFTTNHDKNAWEASDAEHLGPAFEAFAALAFLIPGMPLIYGGQEAVLDRRLPFFTREPLEWKDGPRAGFYRRLVALKKGNRALWNGLAGSPVEYLTADVHGVFALRRSREGQSVTGVFNLSPEARTIGPQGSWPGGTLAPWGYVLEVKE